MKKNIFLTAVVFAFAGCHVFFTSSPVSGLQRDISDLSNKDQKIGYAKSILGSGDTEAILIAYIEIDKLRAADPNDSELNLLAAQLAVGACGMNEIVKSIFEQGDSADVALIANDPNLNAAILANVPVFINIVLNNGDDVPDSTLAIAAETSVLLAVRNGVSLTDLENWTPADGPLSAPADQTLIDATVFILAMNDSGGIAEQLTDFFS